MSIFISLQRFMGGSATKTKPFDFEKGYEEHSAGMIYLPIDPFWDNVRSDPRYADFLRRTGLTQPE
jgi:hypothetical protein